MEFRHYVIRRLLLQIVIIFGAFTLAFIAANIMPGDPVAARLGIEGMKNPQMVQAVKELWKLDKPIWTQYVWYLNNVLHGNLGRSLWSDNPVADDLATRFPATAELTIIGFIIATAIAIPAGIISATHRGSIMDHLTRTFSITGVCAPQFWWGILLLLVFYLYLGILSSGRLGAQYVPPPFVTGMYTLDSLIACRFDMFLDALTHLILPALTLGITCTGVMMRVTRSSMIEVLDSDYITMARMKGLSERVVIYRHALRNSLIPTVTYAGVLFGGMLGGSIMVETVFNWHGMGEYMVNVIFANDYPGMLGVALAMALIFTTCNLIVDLLYGFIDPRVRYG